MNRKNESGFTLLELLLVLSIVFMLSALAFPVGQKIAQKKADKKAMQWIVGLIHNTQILALANEEVVYITFYNSKYKIRSKPAIEIVEGEYPDGIHFHGNSKNEYEFLSNGNISGNGTSTFTTKSGPISLKVQMTRGRVIIDG